MDNKNAINNQTTTVTQEILSSSPDLPESKAQTNTPQKPLLSDAEAQALLQSNNLKPKHTSQISNNTLIFLLIIVLLAMSVLAVVFYNQDKNKKPSPGSSHINPVNNPVQNGDGSIKQDQKYCSNPINAALSC